MRTREKGCPIGCPLFFYKFFEKVLKNIKKLFNPSLSTITIPVPEGEPFEDDRARQHSYVIGNDMFLKMRRYFR